MSRQTTAHLARCEAEIAEAEALLRNGHPDVEGLTMAVADWSNERRAIEAGDYAAATERGQDRLNFGGPAGDAIKEEVLTTGEPYRTDVTHG